MMTSLYAGLKDAEIGAGGRYIGTLGVGQFSFRVIRMLVKPTRKSGLCTIGELELIESHTPSEPLGQKITWLQSHKEVEMALKAVKEFCAALYGYYHPEDKERIKTEFDPHVVGLMDRAVGPENLFSGKCITSDNYQYTAKGSQKLLVLQRWSPFEGVEPPARVEPAPAAPAYHSGHPAQHHPNSTLAISPPGQTPGWAGGQGAAQWVPGPPAIVQPPNYVQPGPAPVYPPAGPPAPPQPVWNGYAWVLPR